MSKHFKLIWQQYNYCAFSRLLMTRAVFSKRNPAGLWLTSEENSLMTVVALCFSWDMCSVLHDWVWAGQSNHIPVDWWFVVFSWFSVTRISDTFWVSTHTSNFANVTSEESPLRKELWRSEWQKKCFPEPVMFLPGMHTQTGEAMCARYQRRVWAKSQ